MSRSYRKPWLTEGQDIPGLRKSRRRLANRRVRRETKDLTSGANFKKHSQSWDIIDYKFYDPKSSKVRRK